MEKQTTSDGLVSASKIMPPGKTSGICSNACRTSRFVPELSSLLLYKCDSPNRSCYFDNLHWLGTDADQSTVHVLKPTCRTNSYA